ncbi:extracellular solute-binding protein [Paenibacillus donghaensis]|uniref:Sugar ABC transporter n=1 Tax=Paenibacillus donghaensis TaxID=414771 RepID=A0A2Z2K5U6_9BACL|nr:extracellular solute-binding protein [Paenibacillus donghaensis]ASA20027.1 sugar ABC transporter [Paenibacillus donghaensis]
MLNKKKLYSTLMAGAMFTGVLAGCGDGNNNNAANEGKAAEDSGSMYSAKFENGKYVEPVTITTVFPISSNMKFKNGENIDNNVHTKWAKGTLGINIKYLWTVSEQNNAYQTKLRLMLSSGQEMPDIISFRGDPTLISDLIESGQFTDAGELFDKYASDTYKAAMAEDPSVWDPYMRDGKRMGIPILESAYNNDPVMYIREDWLKKLNLKAPTTVDELETVMDAFVNQDPDGNGKKDTIALSVGFKNNLNTWMSDAGWIFGMYGTMPNQWNKTEEGKLVYGSIQPEMKSALAKMQDWMTKGYMSQESGLYDEAKATEAFTAGKSGIIVGPYWMTGWPIPDLKGNVPDSEYKAYPLPAGPDGTVGRHGTQISSGAVLINKDMKNKDAFFVYQNYLFDNWANPDGEGPFSDGFAEGYDYAFGPNGEKYGEQESDKIEGGWVDAIRYTLTFDGAIIPSLRINGLAKLANGEAPSTPFEETLTTAIPEQMQAAKIVIDQKDAIMMNMFTGSPTKTQLAKGDMLSKLEKEVLNKIIYNKMPIDEFDSFVAKYRSSGGDDIEKEVNEWYDSVKK